MTTTPLTEQQLDEIAGRAAGMFAHADLGDEDDQREAERLTGTDVPLLLAEVRRLQGQRRYLIDQLARKDARSGEADEKLREFLGAELQPGPDTLPAWLYSRFINALDAPAWDLLTDADRAYWEHQARAVRRAVERGGFKAVAPDAASVPPGATVSPVQPSSVSESAQSPTGAAEGALRDSGAEQRDRRARYQAAIDEGFRTFDAASSEDAYLIEHLVDGVLALADTEQAELRRERDLAVTSEGHSA